MKAEARVLRVGRIGLVVRDLRAASGFYQALGFEVAAPQSLSVEEVEQGFGLVATGAEAVRLRLGAETVELVAFDPPGRPYPQPRAANDPWFQHFAIAVSDMPAAYAALSKTAQQPISPGGPQLLPPSTGSVTAYKFRDPEGHPLELSYIPGSAWLDPSSPAAPTPFLGVDHSAIAVADLETSLAFYTGALGLTLEATLLNQGPEQARLDGLPGAELDIAVLRPADPASPHLELLHYRAPLPTERRRSFAPNDIGATRLVLEVGEVAAMLDRARAARTEVVAASGEARALLRDPDGHLIALEEAGAA